MNKIGANKIGTLPIKDLILNRNSPQRKLHIGYRWKKGSNARVINLEN